MQIRPRNRQSETLKEEAGCRKDLEKKQAIFFFILFVNSKFQFAFVDAGVSNKRTRTESVYSSINRPFSDAANLQDTIAHAKCKPKGEIPHWEQEMLLCLDVTHSGCSGWSCALMWSYWEEGLALQWSYSNGFLLDSLPKGFQALSLAGPL